MKKQKYSVSKMEKRERKRREREEKRAQDRKQYTRQKRTKRILHIGAIGIIIILGYFFFFNDNNASNNGGSSQGVLRLSTETITFGPVSVQKGMVQQEIPLFNVGEENLTISSLDSSCGCTTASIINEGEEGPIFQMSNHGKNPTNWETVIPPGGQASLKVYYNPRTHPKLRGPVTRIVTIFSDDKSNKQQEVRISVNQVD